jgi:hypothetical protein
MPTCAAGPNETQTENLLPWESVNDFLTFTPVDRATASAAEGAWGAAEVAPCW